MIPLALISVLVVPIAKLKEKWKENKRFRLAGLIGGGSLGVVFLGGWAFLVISRFSDVRGMFHHALTQSRVLGGYFARVLLPSDLCGDHHISWTKSWSDGPAFVGLALVIVIVIVIASASALIILNFVIRHRSWFAVLCGLALFHLYLRFGYSVDELMVEYRMSLAMPWNGLFLALGITRLCELPVFVNSSRAFLRGYVRLPLPHFLFFTLSRLLLDRTRGEMGACLPWTSSNSIPRTFELGASTWANSRNAEITRT